MPPMSSVRNSSRASRAALPLFARRAWPAAIDSGEWDDWRWQVRNRLDSAGAILDVYNTITGRAPALAATGAGG